MKRYPGTLKTGSTIQQKAYDAVQKLNILHDLAGYTPLVCGTIPLGIQTEHSDLDVVLFVSERNFNRFQKEVTSLYGTMEEFTAEEKDVHGTSVVKANFLFAGFEFELFGQPVPSHRQRAFEHMVTEAAMLRMHPEIKEKVIELKIKGMKTEPAFASVLHLRGDPYEAVLKWGHEHGILPVKESMMDDYRL
ncbi:DUF4269 domain-containing protein [Alteribacter natronophilus]|uniref:DUF4269 domain-containing protein n=1 Tax=Alteribacter natronophilus TaxID=2583810 RepID=UPI001FE323FA|nr:DUF4269 domain-containing protein [Alteribacter natronophilus]